MPNWLDVIFIALAGLFVLYVLMVVAQWVIVAVLRRQYAPTRKQIDAAQLEVSNARRRLDQLAPFIASGAREMPFAPLYEQARDLVGKASQNVQQATRKVDAIAGERIADEPATAALKIVPMTREISRRMGMREGVRIASVQLSSFGDALARINQLQTEIVALPNREKDALAAVKQHAEAATAAIEKETRPKQLLTQERQTLRQAKTHIEQASHLLSGDAPTEAAVVAAYPMRLKSEESLNALDGLLAVVKDKREKADASLATLVEQLDMHRREITTEETGGYARPNFAATAQTLSLQVDALKAVIASGEYDVAATTAANVLMRISTQASALGAVRAERARIIGMADKATRNIETMNQWIKETPQHFDLDLTRATQMELRDAVDALRNLAPLEDVAAMGGAADVDKRVDETFRHATDLRKDFEANRNKFDEITNLVNEKSVQTMVAQSRQASDDLARVNETYWGELLPDKLTQSAEALSRVWEGEKSALVKISETDLLVVLKRLQAARETFLKTGGMYADALRVFSTVEADKVQVNAVLNFLSRFDLAFAQWSWNLLLLMLVLGALLKIICSQSTSYSYEMFGSFADSASSFCKSPYPSELI